ncbi:Glutamate receptor ionotropic, delta-2 [Folsomia candida]|uniref:Glutamate receptor ionotropic, delta-2 n=1 Tax=Folsomia candida TaxID=158441 RepID=A0A226EQT4_FOLCA|nr:Glutamate receptor ionotropic, delta-2 [Folsomia candida]
MRIGGYFRFTENFGIAFIKEDTAFELCVQGGNPPEISDMNCDLKDSKDILARFVSLKKPPIEFELLSIDNTDVLLEKSDKIRDLMSETINPFVRTSRSSIHQHFLQAIFQRINTSLIYCGKKCKYNGGGFIQLNKFSLDSTCCSVLTEFSGYQFLTCYSETRINFKFYITPFEPSVWLCLAFSVCVVITFLFSYVKFITRNTFFSSWLSVVGTMFEESSQILRQLIRHDFIRWMLTGWTLGCLILINSYTGLMISELNSPFSQSKVEKFQDLVCENDKIHLFGDLSDATVRARLQDHYKIIRWYVEKTILEASESNTSHLPNYSVTSSDECFRLLSPPEMGSITRNPKAILFKFFYFLAKWSTRKEEQFKLNLYEKLYLTLLHPKHGHGPKNFDKRTNYSAQDIQKMTEEEIVQCGKSVFVAESNALKAEEDFLNKHYFWIKFQKGKEQINSFPTGWITSREGISKVPNKLESLIETGVHERLQREVMSRKYLYRTPAILKLKGDVIDNAVGMTGAIVTLFILCATKLIDTGKIN